MHRFFAEGVAGAGSEAVLRGDEARHAYQVLRLRPGDECELLCAGERWRGEITSLTPEEGRARALSPLPSTEPRLRVTLYQGLPKGDKMETIIQKAVELGAAAAVPVAMARCVARLDAKDAAKKTDRWQRIAAEACKQSGRCAMPEVCPVVSAAKLPALLSAHQAAIVPWEEERALSLAGFVREHPDLTDLAVVIGPEGGISPEEIGAMKAAGCVPVTLGPRILRTETAGMAAIAALMALCGEMEVTA